MSKAEAIVVTEPKTKVVPEFNEEEVVGIVNKNIENGKVAIPAGGAKLYLHLVTVERTGESDLYITVYLVNDSKPLTIQRWQDYTKRITNCLFGSFGNSMLATNIGSKYPGDGLYAIGFKTKTINDDSVMVQTEINIPYSNIIAVTDTVTEL